MRRTHQPSALTALAVAIGVTLAVLVPFATRAGAQTTEHRPSCSLHPTRHDTAGWIFENHNHERRFLTATTTDGTVLFNDFLYPITQVGDDPAYPTPQLRQTPLLVGLIHVDWADDSYDVAEYALPDLPEGPYCAGQPTTTTTTPPPTTTSTVPVAPPPTTPPPTAPPTTIPAAPPVTEPTLSCLTARCEFTVATTPAVGVEAAVATRAAPLPNTGRDMTGLALIGVGLLGAGAMSIIAGRRRPAGR